MLSGDFVPHIIHGTDISYPLRPSLGGKNTGNIDIRGSLILQLMIRRGGESLASEALKDVVVVEVLRAKNVPGNGCRRIMFCVLRADGKELGRTLPASCISSVGGSICNSGNTGVSTGEKMSVEWEDQGHIFPLSLSPANGWSLPYRLSVEVWYQEAPSKTNKMEPHKALGVLDFKRPNTAVKVEVERGGEREDSPFLAGMVDLGPDDLIWSKPGQVSFPLLPPKSEHERTVESIETNSPLGEIPSIELRLTPKVGERWATQVMTAASTAKRVTMTNASGISKQTSKQVFSQGQVHSQGHGDSVDVLYMTNAEGSERTRRMPVSPGNPVPPAIFEDAIELVCASQPSCCPRGPTLAVAPFSDIGVKIGGNWVGPEVGLRHAIVAHRVDFTVIGSSNSTTEQAPAEDEIFLRGVAAETEGLLRKARALDMRNEQCRLALKHVESVCTNWSHQRLQSFSKTSKTDKVITAAPKMEKDNEDRSEETSIAGVKPTHKKTYRHKRHREEQEKPQNEGEFGFQQRLELGGAKDKRAYNDLFSKFLSALESTLPGVSMYVGLVQYGGQVIRFVASNRRSQMTGNVLKRGEGISFSCVGPQFLPHVMFPDGDSKICGSDPGRAVESLSPSQPVTIATSGVGRMLKGFHAKTGRFSGDGDASANSRMITIRERSKNKDVKAGNIFSTEESAVTVQKSFRGKLGRLHAQYLKKKLQQGVQKAAAPRILSQATQSKVKTPTRAVPRIFDYGGRVGWPFVCVPLVTKLGCSSIGILGFDTFDYIGKSQEKKLEPKALETMCKAARLLGETIDSDRKLRALSIISASAKNCSSTLVEVLDAAMLALTSAVVTSSKVEVWRIKPSKGSIYLLTKHAP
ncbi:unnamed protein product, partial [Choristocarpus tenellus]